MQEAKAWGVVVCPRPNRSWWQQSQDKHPGHPLQSFNPALIQEAHRIGAVNYPSLFLSLPEHSKVCCKYTLYHYNNFFHSRYTQHAALLFQKIPSHYTVSKRVKEIFFLWVTVSRHWSLRSPFFFFSFTFNSFLQSKNIVGFDCKV